MWHQLPGLFRSQNSIMVLFVLSENISNRLQWKSGHGRLKNGQILKLKNVNKKGVFLVQFNLKNAMVSFVPLWDILNHCKSHVNLHNCICSRTLYIAYINEIFIFLSCMPFFSVSSRHTWCRLHTVRSSIASIALTISLAIRSTICEKHLFS